MLCAAGVEEVMTTERLDKIVAVLFGVVIVGLILFNIWDVWAGN